MTYPRRPTKINREAFAVRAGAIGLLECCDCSFPVAMHDTETGHALTCQSHGMTLSALSVGRTLLPWSKKKP